MTSRWLNATEDRAWRGYRRLFTLLESRLARELSEESGLSVADYSVLSNLAETDDRRWRITELAERMQWSQSRLSHHLRRMEERGLVTRQQAPGDARGAFVSLTRAGLKAIASATPTHFAGVRRHLIDLLTEEQLQVLGDIAETVVGHLDSDSVDVPS